MILHRLEAEIDELWSFVGTKANRQWVWIDMAADTRQIIAFHVGDRSRQSAEDQSCRTLQLYHGNGSLG